jgi:hypothetical protein
MIKESVMLFYGISNDTGVNGVEKYPVFVNQFDVCCVEQELMLKINIWKR